MGTSTATDSLTPRRLSTVSTTTPARAQASRPGCQAAGRKLKIASAPLATDRVMVRT